MEKYRGRRKEAQRLEKQARSYAAMAKLRNCWNGCSAKGNQIQERMNESVVRGHRGIRRRHRPARPPPLI